MGPVPACVHDVLSPMNIYAWNGAVENPFEPDMRGRVFPVIRNLDGSGDPEDEFTDTPASVLRHRVRVLASSLGLTRDNADPVWLWEGGAKIEGSTCSRNTARVNSIATCFRWWPQD